MVRGGGQRAQDVVLVSDMDGQRNLSAPRGQQLARVHSFRGGCMNGQLCPKGRGVADESTKFRDHKGDEADVVATPHFLLVLLELSLPITA
jgi:hypothetical protein